ncbi:MAG: carotenoid biosynthesis protein [Deltaproteobacteria bacterium]|nr:carotenoid biosynthesis protein [Deltaproteobacteria bacterium]
MDILARIVGMVIHRPYVFIFFAIYLVTAVTRLGWRRSACFTGIAYAVALAAELSSTRNGFPFGLYHYIDVTRDRELWIGNVPFWDSFSFTFLCYLGWRLGVLLYAPLVIAPRVFQVAETRAVATSWRVAVSGALLMTWLDVVIDPLTVLGDRWFLGKIYYYPRGGLYFGVPLSNFAGWFLVGLTTIRLYQAVEVRARGRLDSAGVRRLPLGGLLEPLLYLGILLFNLVLTFTIGEPLLGTIGILLYVPIVVLVLSHPLNPRRRATADDLTTHARDYPRSKVPSGIGGVRAPMAPIGGDAVARPFSS